MTPDSLKKAINIAVMQKYGALSEEANALQKLYVTEKAFMNWQPIETAPKDGSEILASVLYQINDKSLGVRETFFLYWVTGLKKHPEGIWSFDHETPLIYGTPTHWMETPEYVEPTTES